MRKLILAFLMLSAAAACFARGECPSVSSKLSVDDIQTLLRSGDRTLTAWGAYFAGESSDDRVVTTMLQLAERGIPPRSQRDPYLGPYFGCVGSPYPDPAMLEILDALIKRREIVPPEVLSAVDDSYPVEAFILASRLPPEKAGPLFERWYYRAEAVSPWGVSRQGANQVLLARLSAMMMAKSPPPGFAASILAGSGERMVVSVANDPARSSYPSPIELYRDRCSDVPSNFPLENLPPLVQYAIEENKPQSDPDYDESHLLVTSGGDRITFRSAPASMSLSRCYIPRPLNVETRHHLLAEMLGVSNDQMPWKTRLNVTLHWESNPRFELDLRRWIESEERKLRATVEALRASGMLTQSEADSTRPRLSVSVYDDRQEVAFNSKPTGAPLPRLAFQNPQTSCDLPEWVPRGQR